MSDLIRSGKRFNVVVSILIAILLWFYVLNVENPVGETTIPNVPIVLQGEQELGEKGLIVTELNRNAVAVKAAGKRKTFLRLYRSNMTVSIDVSAIDEEGEHRLAGRVMPDSLRLDSSIHLSEKDNFYVNVTVAKKASKEVPVVGEFRGTMANGYEADPVEVTPGSIEVTGPEDVIAQISRAVVSLTGENVKESIQQEAPIVFVSEEGKEIKEDSLIYRSKTVNATLPVMRVYEVPLNVEIKGGGGANPEDAVWTISPSSIRLSGSEELLADLKSITLGSIDLGGVFASKTQTFPIPLPEGVINRSGVTEATVTLTVESLPMKMVTSSRISVINPPKGMKASLVGDSLQVWVRGKQGSLDAVTGDHVRVVVDLKDSGFTRGQHRAAATVYLEDISDVGVVGTDYSVGVNLQ